MSIGTTNSSLTDIVMTASLATELSKKLLETMLSKEYTREIQDDAHASQVSRSKSRFGTSSSHNDVLSMEFSPSAQMVAYSKADGTFTVCLLDELAASPHSKRSFITEILGRGHQLTSISWNPNEMAQFVAIENNQSVLFWAKDDKKRKFSKIRTILLGTKSKVSICSYDPTGKWLVVLTKSDCLYFYNVEQDYELKHSLVMPDSFSQDSTNQHITCLGWHNSGNQLFLGTFTGGLKIVAVNEVDCSIIQELDAHRASITCCKMDPLGNFLVTASDDGTCNFWNIPSLTCSVTITEINASISSLDLCPHGKILGVVTHEQRALFYDTLDGQLLGETLLAKQNNGILRFYPNKSWFLISGKNGTINRHFTPPEYQDQLTLWKCGLEGLLPPKRGKNVHNSLPANPRSNGSTNNKKSLKREREFGRDRGNGPPLKRARDGGRLNRFTGPRS